MIYLLVVLMLVKVAAVNWTNDNAISELTFQRQLEITGLLAVLLFLISLGTYLWDYPAPFESSALVVVGIFALLDYALLRGHTVMSYVVFVHMYGKSKRRKYKEKKVERFLQMLILGLYCVLGSISTLLVP